MMNLAVFVFFYLIVYTGLHALLYWGGRRLLPPGRSWTLGTLLFLGLMELSPIGYRLLEGAGHHGPARLVAQIGFIWMGVAVLALVCLGVRDLFLVASRLIRPGRAKPGPRASLSRRRALATLAAAPPLAVYGLWEARRVRVKRLSITTEKLPANLPRLKLALISDLHLSVMTDEQWLEGVMARLKAEKPDILLSAGDLLDGRLPGMAGLARHLRQVPAPLGKFAVLGNHEFYVGLSRSLQLHQKAGFRVLRGQGVSPAGALNLVGVDDQREPDGKAEAEILAGRPGGLFTIMLRHRPLVPPPTRGLFDLQLSGHTHGGQITPFGLLVKLQFRYLAGLYPLEEGGHIYVSRGTGTWGPPMRVAAPPEITLVELRRGRAAA